VPDRTLPPTARRLQRALASGDVPVSRVTLAVAAIVSALATATTTGAAVAASFGSALDHAVHGRLDTGSIASDLVASVLRGALPICLTMATGVLVVGVAQTGGRVTLGRRTSPPGASSPPWITVVGILSPLVVGASLVAICVSALRTARWEVGASPLASIGVAALGAAWRGALVLGIWGVLDVLLTRVAWRARLQMTVDERRREEREMHGDPLVRRARRDARQRS
jgi:flagellar biosynthesis protein FlhB